MASSKTQAPPIEEKLKRARDEGRSQTALDLAKQLAKESPTPANQQLLRDVSLERGEHLLREGKDREAATVFTNALRLGPDADAQARIGARLAQAGDLAAANDILARLADGPARTRLVGQIADAALERDQRDRLEPDLHAGFDSVVHAFARYERGQDAEALDTLQTIGLRSPFLEWRVLLRGLSAYSRGEDARALENWQRLDPERLPWRLVAPFRFRIDPAFRDAQPAETAKRLAGQLDRSASSLAPILRSIDADIHKQEKASRILTRLEPIVPSLKARHPTLVPKLVRALYAAILAKGTPHDIEKLIRILPPLAEDPQHLLLWGLLATQFGENDRAAGYFLEFDEAIEKDPRLVGEDPLRARAMLWERIGDLVADSNFDETLQPIQKGKPTADKCFRKSIELLPSRRSVHMKLRTYLAADPKTAPQIVPATYAMVKVFPNDADAWSLLGRAHSILKEFDKAEHCYAEAVRSNPLEPELREEWEVAIWKRVWATAVKLARKRKADLSPLRPELERAALAAGLLAAARLADWAMLEHRLGNRDLAHALRERAASRPGDRLAAAVAFHLVSGTGKVDAETKAECAAALDEALKATPTFDELMAVFAVLDAWEPPIKGRSAVVKRLLPLLGKKALNTLDESQSAALGEAMLDVVPDTKLKSIASMMRKRFPRSPELVLLDFDLRLNRAFLPPLHLLDEASHLAAGLPRERQQRILDEVQMRCEEDPEFGDMAEAMLDFFENERFNDR